MWRWTHPYDVLSLCNINKSSAPPQWRKVTVCENEPNGLGLGGEAKGVWSTERGALKASLHSLSNTMQQMSLVSSQRREREDVGISRVIVNPHKVIVENQLFSPALSLTRAAAAATVTGIAGHCRIGWDQISKNRLTSFNTMDTDKWSFQWLTQVWVGSRKDKTQRKEL